MVVCWCFGYVILCLCYCFLNVFIICFWFIIFGNCWRMLGLKLFLLGVLMLVNLVFLMF